MYVYAWLSSAENTNFRIKTVSDQQILESPHRSIDKLDDDPKEIEQQRGEEEEGEGTR